ncbi:FMN-binding protein [Natroniella sp. ANB-PHB2]|uniref:FMN-binding protein n=1 Tax=Natroniella sp. ANB-PHB2 TaxID=3384444 RepID=UPI0038D4EF7E
MAKDKIELRLILVLIVITMASAITLTFVNEITAPVIAEQAERRANEAILAVMPDAVEFIEKEEEGVKFYRGLDETGEEVGVAIKEQSQGYAGEVEVMVGLDMDEQKVIDITILDHSETPGLGSRIEEEDFKEQFRGVEFSEVEVDMITGATISSMVVQQVVEEAIDNAKLSLGLAEDAAQPGVAIFDDVDEFVSIEDNISQALDALGEAIGLVSYGKAEGYNGYVEVAVGLDLDSEKVIGVEIIDHSETAGIGSKIEEEDFKSQFNGVNFSELELDMITGATVSSDAVYEAIEEAVEIAENYGGGE